MNTGNVACKHGGECVEVTDCDRRFSLSYSNLHSKAKNGFVKIENDYLESLVPLPSSSYCTCNDALAGKNGRDDGNANELAMVLADNKSLRDQLNDRETMISEMKKANSELRQQIWELFEKLHNENGHETSSDTDILTGQATTNVITISVATQTNDSDCCSISSEHLDVPDPEGSDLGYYSKSPADLEMESTGLTSEDESWYTPCSTNTHSLDVVESGLQSLPESVPSVSACLAVCLRSPLDARPLPYAECTSRGRFDPYVPEEFDAMLVAATSAQGRNINSKTLASSIYKVLAPISSLYAILLWQSDVMEYSLCCGNKDRVVEYTIVTQRGVIKLAIFSWMGCQEVNAESCFVTGASKMASSAKLTALANKHLNKFDRSLHADSDRRLLSAAILKSAIGELCLEFCGHWLAVCGQNQLDVILTSKPQVAVRALRSTSATDLFLAVCHK